MADAIHVIERGESLDTVAALYYALRHLHGPLDALRRPRIIRAIRESTPADVTRLDPDDAAPLPLGATLFVPTLRGISRAIFAEPPEVARALEAAGFPDARALLRQPADRVVALLRTGGTPLGATDLARAWTLTAFLNLDGMDRFTARHLHDVRHVTSLQALADTPEATLLSWLAELVHRHDRPALLNDPRRVQRWITAARVHARPRGGELTRAVASIFDVAISPVGAEANAKDQEAASRVVAAQDGRADVASLLATIYRVQAAVLRGHAAVVAGQAAEAVRWYQDARRRWHEIARTTGAIGDVDDNRGLNLAECVAVAGKILARLPKASAAGAGKSPRAARRARSSRPSIGSPAAYVQAVIIPRLQDRSGAGLALSRDDWNDIHRFVAALPYVYATHLPLGLGRAYAAMGREADAGRFGAPLISFDPGDFTSIIDRDPRDTVLLWERGYCFTTFGGPRHPGALTALLMWARDRVKLADRAYEHDLRTKARAIYGDVICGIDRHLSGMAQPSQQGFRNVIDGLRRFRQARVIDPLAVRRLRDLTTLEAFPNMVVTRSAPDGSPRHLADISTSLSSLFAPISPSVLTTSISRDVGGLSIDGEVAGAPLRFGGVEAYDLHLPDMPGEMMAIYHWCAAKLVAIAAGLNWYGYRDDYVPPWSFEHLYGEARNLCDRALDVEQRVVTLLQLYESSLKEELGAAQAAELAGAELTVAEARVEQQIAANELSAAQAELAQQQAQAASNKSAAAANIAMVTFGAVAVGTIIGAGAIASVATAGAAVPFAIGGVIGTVGIVATFANASTGHAEDEIVLDKAKTVTEATTAANEAALAVATAERDVASMRARQAVEFQEFLGSLQLNSTGYAHLLGLTREVLDVYVFHANRMAWLTQRALEHESRQSSELVKTSYTTGDTYADMTRANRLTADLEVLRAQYVAGQTRRLQEVRWTIALSQLDAIAYGDLRQTGSCTFVLRQRAIDMFFPGMYQHRLKEARIEIVGLVPPDGARGILKNSGVSWVRVPDEGDFVASADITTPDWVTTSLAGSAAFSPYNRYVLKQVVGVMATLALSQFDVRADRAVLSSPLGMLKPLEHQGLDAAWTLTLHRQSNNFEFSNIIDVEFTFWFLCAHDEGLQRAQMEALIEDGRRGRLSGAARRAFAVHDPDLWRQVVTGPAQRDGLDVRFLGWTVGAERPAWEDRRRLQNVSLGFARPDGVTDELTVRIASERDPVGVKATTSAGAVFTLLGITLSPQDPTSSGLLESWVQATYYSGGAPTQGPDGRWVIKLTPALMGAAWLARDPAGITITSRAGSLRASGGGLARFRDGATWTDVLLRATVVLGGMTHRLRVRDDGTNHYALELAPAAIALYRVEGSHETRLASRALAFPSDEPLRIEVRIVGQTLMVFVDTLPVLPATAGGAGAGRLTNGTIGLESKPGSGANAVFDDVEVIRLSPSGEEAEFLLRQPFADTLPTDWTFTHGGQPWSIEPAGLPRLDLTRLLNATLSLEYQHDFRPS